MRKSLRMNTLLVHPAFPKTYWGMDYAPLLTNKSALLPPLGSLTVAALLPPDSCPRLLDMSVETLNDEDLAWADVVFVGAMQTNFETRMPERALLDGYGQLLADLYAPDAYFARCLRVLELWPLKRARRFRFPFRHALVTLARTVWRLGVRAPYRNAFWRFMGKALWRKPSLFGTRYFPSHQRRTRDSLHGRGCLASNCAGKSTTGLGCSCQ